VRNCGRDDSPNCFASLMLQAPFLMAAFSSLVSEMNSLSLRLDRRISLFICLPLGSIDKLAIQREIDRIGRE